VILNTPPKLGMNDVWMRIRTGLAKLLHWLTAPLRLLARPLIAWRNFLRFEPEETPVADLFVRTLENPASLVDHLEALRRHLLRSLGVLVLTTLASTLFAGRLLDWLAQPVGGIEQLQAIEVTESIGAFMRVTLLSGFTLASPYIGLELFAFINPGLRPRERVFVLTAIPAAVGLFALGMTFAYKLMLPIALPFLLNFLGITTVPRPANYIRFVTGVMFWIGVSFQFPLVIYSLARLGLVQARALARAWRFAILGIAILAAAVTPTIDPVNMGLVMAPMIVLYFVSIALAFIGQRSHTRAGIASKAEELSPAPKS
jgi:sec-independent protein translocase protein TatC